ncbi:uncharacterized protein MEPE_05576 [Melanopsichium pennsylvanicum]|uniref:Uncharacterized protein n=2 Tax=Melanopsichium pennsylvanicum TaxID=63383 RepID=A0AAJ5C7F6_9BASI|nr:uncharacterized protein MEPE_05576 [Melanopsichium pennsylvanicum]
MSQHSSSGSSLSSSSFQTSFKLSSPMGVDLQVWLSDDLESNTNSNEHRSSGLALGGSGMAAHHLTFAATVISTNRSTLHLDHHQMKAILVPMLEDINTLRNGWLSISDILVHPCVHAAMSFEHGTTQCRSSPAHIQVTLVPASTNHKQIATRYIRVDLEWIDLRHERQMPLTNLFQRGPLTGQLRNVVQHMTSRLLVEALLKPSSSAELFHRAWQHRQCEVGPLVDSIAASLCSLVSHSNTRPQLTPLLQRLDLQQNLPNIITIGNHLTQVDLAAYPAAAQSSVAAGRNVRYAHGELKPSIKPEELAESFESASEEGDLDMIAASRLEGQDFGQIVLDSSTGGRYDDIDLSSSDSPEPDDEVDLSRMEFPHRSIESPVSDASDEEFLACVFNYTEARFGDSNRSRAPRMLFQVTF